MDKRAVEGSASADGLVLALQLQTSSAYEAVYTIPVAVGGSSNIYSLQVDTGSSDLWIASTACSSSSCRAIGGSNLFNPSGAVQTGFSFNITYLQGSVSGPIVWDQVGIGGYNIDNQALAAASVVDNEPLTSSFQGILGLALPLNSVIASIIHPVTGNTPDGAAWASNLFSLTPVSTAPAAHFLSLSLERPGSDRVPSLLGIGRHPSSLVSDPSSINYFPLVSNRAGIIYWKVSVRAITVYVNGQRKPVVIDASADGEEYPTAVLDSGAPVILTTPNIANGIYGALGIGPAADGNYYVPCTTPLNMTITLDNRPEIPLHPLDLTTEPPNNNRAQYCVGMIQASQTLQDPSSGIGDMILGVPFLRNTYTVMGYDTPFPNGSFPLPSAPGPSSSPDSEADIEIHPALGLLALTNATIALQEFQTVRVFNQPLSSSGTNGTSGGGGSGGPVTVGSKRLSVGMVVLIVLLGFFALCCALFGFRWMVMRKRFEGAEEGGVGGGSVGVGVGGKGMLESGGEEAKSGDADVDSERSLGDGGLDKIMGTKRGSCDEESEVEAVVVRPRNRTGASSSRVESDYTASSGRTRVGNDDFGFVYGVGSGSKVSAGSRWSLVADDSNFPLVRRSTRVSQGSGGKVPLSPLLHPGHERNPSLAVPVLPSSDSTQQQHSFDAGGVGVDPSASPTEDADERQSRVDDASGSSMAGVGTARGRLSQFESFTVPFSRESFLSGSTVGEEEPSFPPLEGVNEEDRTVGEEERAGSEGRETQAEEEQEPPPQPVTHNTPIPSGAGNPVYPPRPASTTILDDFDPYDAP